ncbi:HTH-type quorum sensing-dependent transcriptional regulator vjbR [Pannonibacter phragmitetus]|uniref:HTH-type quorum sensing-dependent transcriptional regulator vjbR n=1 Tax=Pannonibacter phragmitetus TaxID=121719 RepID=A0A378ZSS9_9HYPH|nr:helix-turn-helix domain-containing protein [Pannonibacter phragmitetus]SUB00207.1 HTH-type quorum sensing-dependent transcriptional regulator vjbR [Pannonibacter phragmitetus]
MMDEAELSTQLRTISESNSAQIVLDVLETNLRRLGATHILVTGLPMPKRSIESLVQRYRWPDARSGAGDNPPLSANDAVLSLGLASDRASVWTVSAGDTQHSRLMAAVGEGYQIIAVPVTELQPFQAFVYCAGPSLKADKCSLAAIEMIAEAVFVKLQDMGVITAQRPGALSTRERKVLELTAFGKTAGEIAELLDISQRTVHAHLQNASVKLNASNKTHTVVEALRYGQIRV